MSLPPKHEAARRAMAHLPACLALGIATLLLAPATASKGFAKLGGPLPVDLRHFRIVDAFADPGANDHLVPEPAFPGWHGAELALWKAAAEWGSGPHGDGSGDPTQAIGDGNANVDLSFAGAAVDAGHLRNVATALPDCGGGGVFAYVLGAGGPWSMVFCDEWTWSDGPAAPGPGELDLQGIGCHEFGHALGLGHSGDPLSVMLGSTLTGFAYRAVQSDDQAGLACIYGPRPASKPVIDGVTWDSLTNTLTITGTGFDPVDNEVRFTNGEATASDAEPHVLVRGVASPSTTTLTVAVPSEAGSGDVQVVPSGVASGATSPSNAWPLDLGRSAAQLHIALVTPNAVPSLQVGPSQTVRVSGGGFTPNTTVTVDGILLDPTSVTRVDGANLTLDLPQVATLGDVEIRVQEGASVASATLSIEAPSGPLLQIENGLPAASNVVRSSDGLQVIYAGPPGELHYVLGSSSNAGSSASIVSLCIGVDFLDLFEVASGVLGPAGYNQEQLALPPLFAVLYFQSVSFSQGVPLPVSNCQSALFLP